MLINLKDIVILNIQKKLGNNIIGKKNTTGLKIDGKYAVDLQNCILYEITVSRDSKYINSLNEVCFVVDEPFKKSNEMIEIDEVIPAYIKEKAEYIEIMQKHFSELLDNNPNYERIDYTDDPFINEYIFESKCYYKQL